ncbi:hypothetical protein E7T09_04415 [Deinococcus sp. KSM4-11]|uniref:hypothetical protein n=1 Tax=Deinococcus sp. KSM4-11 TaxID=2568654 RepID=UPI0010A50925|nr:hypothetical protein [Deinococcus sp. KSM4-11]THF88454.1 hypothetical protein E7T09_04415 [Deinococcus sp. KSM4-11]
MFNLQDLDETTRNYMAEEIQMDIDSKNLYHPDRLSPYGSAKFHQLLLESARTGNPDQLAKDMQADGNYFDHTEVRSNGVQAKVPSNAANILAEGEFNRYYLRALALRAKADGVPSLQIYRARPSRDPRFSSEARIGDLVPVDEVLAELRKTPVKGQPAGLIEPNSGLSFRIPV